MERVGAGLREIERRMADDGSRKMEAWTHDITLAATPKGIAWNRGMVEGVKARRAGVTGVV
jgi:hypothetical protein